MDRMTVQPSGVALPPSLTVGLTPGTYLEGTTKIVSTSSCSEIFCSFSLWKTLFPKF